MFLEDLTNSINEAAVTYRTKDREVLSNKNGNQFKELNNGKFKIYVKKLPVRAFGSYLTDYQNTDFLNIDAEGSDYKIIRQIDLKKSNISLVAIDTHDPNGNKLLDFDNISKYFENNLYFVHKKIGPTTLYIKK